MLDVRPDIFIKGKPILSSEKMLHKDYHRKGPVEKKIPLVVRESQVAWRQDELTGRTPPVVK
jgi:hypothetical protein